MAVPQGQKGYFIQRGDLYTALVSINQLGNGLRPIIYEIDTLKTSDGDWFGCYVFWIQLQQINYKK